MDKTKLLLFETKCKDIKCDWYLILVCYKLLASIIPKKIPPDFKKKITDALDTVIKDLDFAELFSDIDNENNADDTMNSLYRQYWELIDNAYYSEYLENLIVRFARNDLNLNELITGKVVLDAGCGSGNYTQALATFNPAKIKGIDINDLTVAQENNKDPKIGFTQASVLDIPYPDSFFDFVFCNGVLHHTTDPLKGMKEIHRVLVPPGRAWIMLYNSDGFYRVVCNTIKRMVRHIPQKTGFRTLLRAGIPLNRVGAVLDTFFAPIEHSYTRAEAEQMLKNAGFNLIQILKRSNDSDITEMVYQDSSLKEVYGEYGGLRFLVG